MAGLRRTLFTQPLSRRATEPWEYGEGFTEAFRRIVELRYRLLPYIYAQAALASREGHPMLGALFFEYPGDPTSWLIEDQYLLGTDVLVAPLMEEAPGREVYLPHGLWIDYQGGKTYEGARWHTMRAGKVPVVMLVREGAAIPHADLAQSTGEIGMGRCMLCASNASTTNSLWKEMHSKAG